jgi:Nucleotide-diphospho-sugar transferase
MMNEAGHPRQLPETSQNKGPLVVVFADSKYQVVLDKWLEAIQRLGIHNYLVVALDHSLCEEMEQRRISALYRPCPANLESLWIHRTDVLLELLKAGYDLVHSDADAFWIKNPLDEFIYDKDHDLIFSPGTYWPQEVHRKWGFVLCCGFFYAQSNSKTLAFFEELAQAVRIDRDDQVSLNRLLLQRGLVWKLQDSYELKIRGKSVKFFTQPAEGNAGDLKICVLPHAQFQRIPAAEDDLYIQHWLSDKTALAKLKVIDNEV